MPTIENDVPHVSNEDFNVAQQLASETTDHDEIVALRETLGRGNRLISVEGVAVPVKSIGKIALELPRTEVPGVINQPYEHGRR